MGRQQTMIQGTQKLYDRRVKSPAGYIGNHSMVTETPVLPKTCRLVVLVPEGELNSTALAQNIWELAAPERLQVLFVTLDGRAENQYSKRRQLTHLAAITRDGRVKTDMHLAMGRNWIKAVRQIYQPGDLVVCLDGQTDHNSLNRRKPIDTALMDGLNVPVFILKQECPPEQPRERRWIGQIAYWGILFFVLASFFEFEFLTGQLLPGWTGNMAFMTLLGIEVLAIYWWTKIAG